MSLYETYCDYLRARAPFGAGAYPLAAALLENGRELEGSLLLNLGWHRRVNIEPWGECPIYVGRYPPEAAEPGSLWLDTVEIAVMLLLETPSFPASGWPPRCYLSVRPVEAWQFCAFFSCATFVKRYLHLQPKRPAFACAQTAKRNERMPMTDMLHGEADMYANWFGKRILSHHQWRHAEASLSPKVDALWSQALQREWAGYSGWSEEHRVVIEPGTWRIDPFETCARGDEDAPQMLGLDDEHFPDVGFRTAASAPPEKLAQQPILLDIMEPVPLTCAAIFHR